MYAKAQQNRNKMSVLRYFTSELTRGYHLEREEEKYSQKRQRVYTFMKTPRELEKFCTFGFFQCVDAFLFVFTFLPVRILLAVLKMFTHPCGFMRSRKLLEPAQMCDILKGIILVVCGFILNHIDTSMMYHLVRGQSTIKLYVFFNMLDMADRLLSSVGHDILDALFWTATEPRGKKREHLGTLTHLIMAIIYVIIHAMLILFQATVLNVAFNSYNKSLLVIMMSNNFVEIKGSLFRKVDLNHLCQISCSDVKERFHYVILLSIVFVRNMTEVSWNPDHLWVILPDGIMVLLSELLVDWGKHAFILKFNEIPADVYAEFKVTLAVDMASGRQHHAFTDISDLVSRRMGLTPLPLACILIRTCSRIIKPWDATIILILVIFYFCLLTFKVLVSIVLLGHAYKVILANQKPSETETANQHTESTSESAAEEAETDKSSSAEFHPDQERRASADNHVVKCESLLYSVDSYSELTMISVNNPIESSHLSQSTDSLQVIEEQEQESKIPTPSSESTTAHRQSLDGGLKMGVIDSSNQPNIPETIGYRQESTNETTPNTEISEMCAREKSE